MVPMHPQKKQIGRSGSVPGQPTKKADFKKGMGYHGFLAQGRS
jgi:hypothetical protein